MRFKILGSFLACGCVASLLMLNSCVTKPEDKASTCPVADSASPKIAILHPLVNDTFHVGDSMLVEWCVSPSFNYSTVIIKFANNPDPAAASLFLTGFGDSISTTAGSRKFYIDDTRVGAKCRIKMSNYSETVGNVRSGYFTILPKVN